MVYRFKARFDGKVLVPDQPVDLPVNQPLELDVTLSGVKGTANGEPAGPDLIREQLRRLDSIAGKFAGPVLPDEALRRENLYDDRP